jgi:hypothetical protein
VIIGVVTVAGDRLGPRVAGALTGLPVVAGPIALFIALEQGPAFAARAARGTLAGEASLGVFAVLYALACVRLPWWVCLPLGWAGFAASTLVLDRLDPPVPAAVGLAVATPVAMLLLTPKPAASGRAPASTRSEIAMRMVAGAALVVAITGVARALGPRLSGLLTIFPIAVTVLAVFSHRNQGSAFAVQMLRGLAVGLYSITAFFTVLALWLEPAGTARGFTVAVVAALGVQVVALRLVRRAP